MKKRLLPTLLVTASVMSMPGNSVAADDAPAMKAPPANSSDLGKSDPLSAIEEKSDSPPPPPEVPAMPEFKEVPAAGEPSSDGADGVASKKNEADSDVDAKANSPAEHSAAAPAPAAEKKPKRASKKQTRVESEPKNIAPDSPDERREQSFHRVYEKYNASPTPLEAWEQASSSRTSENYKIQKNDTLWDLSKTLFGDPNYWPKIWALNNDEVLNPHQIETWMQIRFYPGDLNEPPTVAIAEAPKFAAPADESKSEEPNLPPARKVKPIVRRLPPSMPSWKMEAVGEAMPAFEGVQAHRTAGPTQMSLSYSVSETPVFGVGEIKETEIGTKTASEFQYVFVTVRDSTSHVFTVVKDIGMLEDPRDADRSEKRPIHLIEYQGEIEIVESVSDRENLQRAIVRKNLTPIEVGARLIPGRIENVNVEDGAISSGPSAQIIGSQFSSGRVMTDVGGIVFLNVGSGGGVHEGVILPVFSNVRMRNPGTGARIHDREVAHAKVVKVTENYSTAILTKVSDDVIVGDSVGASPTGRGTDESLSGAPISPQTDSSSDEIVPADRASAAPSGEDLDADFEAPDAGSSTPAATPSPADSDPSSPAADEDLSL